MKDCVSSRPTFSNRSLVSRRDYNTENQRDTQDIHSHFRNIHDIGSNHKKLKMLNTKDRGIVHRINGFFKQMCTAAAQWT